MGFLNNLFGKKSGFMLPTSGEVIDITDVPDEVFAGKMMGDGFAIKPTDGKIYAPIAGEIASIFPHAYGIRGKDGLEVLIHVGLETVNLKGEGFDVKVVEGQKIEAGELLVIADLEAIEPKVKSLITPVVFTDLKGHSFEYKKGNYTAKSQDAVIVK